MLTSIATRSASTTVPIVSAGVNEIPDERDEEGDPPPNATAPEGVAPSPPPKRPGEEPAPNEELDEDEVVFDDEWLNPMARAYDAPVPTPMPTMPPTKPMSSAWRRKM